MTTKAFVLSASSYRSAGWAAIASGIIGILAYIFLLSAVLTRSSWIVSRYVYLMFRFHDVGGILQFLFLIPVAVGLQKLSHQQSPGISRPTLKVGIGALLFTAIFLLLGIVKVLSDGHYTVPLGVFGVWLIVVNWRLSGLLPQWLRWFGMVVGFGLFLFGSFFPAFAIFVDPVILRIPPVDIATYPEPPMNLANTILHQLIWIGSIMGVLPLPIWTILTGRRLLRESSI